MITKAARSHCSRKTAVVAGLLSAALKGEFRVVFIWTSKAQHSGISLWFQGLKQEI